VTAPRRLGLAVALGAVLTPAAPPASADEAIARRLATLHFLVHGEALRAAVYAEVTAPGPCLDGAWWRSTGAGQRSRTSQALRDASIRFGVDARLIRSVIRHESDFDAGVVSHKGAMGLMQLMPGTARALGVTCPFDPRQNVMAGTRYLRRLYDRFGDWPLALAAYHAGPTRVEGGRIPAETRRYVTRVLRSWKPGRYGGARLFAGDGRVPSEIR
jgi:soluble lytic murein transglycosylase-like protein